MDFIQVCYGFPYKINLFFILNVKSGISLLLVQVYQKLRNTFKIFVPCPINPHFNRLMLFLLVFGAINHWLELGLMMSGRIGRHRVFSAFTFARTHDVLLKNRASK